MSGKRKWIPIAIGIVILLFFIAAGAVIFTVSYARDHLQIATSSEADAMRAFDEVHAKFPGHPLIEIKDGEPTTVGERSNAPSSRVELTTMHVLAWDPDHDHLVRAEIPFWLLRLKSGPISFSSYAAGLRNDRVRLTVEDIERHGPGIVVDVTDTRRNRGRALVWAE
ncbi:MAG: hypothetical protein ABI665_16015 [Vicinamibacterales bacterium]